MPHALSDRRIQGLLAFGASAIESDQIGIDIGGKDGRYFKGLDKDDQPTAYCSMLTLSEASADIATQLNLKMKELHRHRYFESKGPGHGSHIESTLCIDTAPPAPRQTLRVVP